MCFFIAVYIEYSKKSHIFIFFLCHIKKKHYLCARVSW